MLLQGLRNISGNGPGLSGRWGQGAGREEGIDQGENESNEEDNDKNKKGGALY